MKNRAYRTKRYRYNKGQCTYLIRLTPLQADDTLIHVRDMLSNEDDYYLPHRVVFVRHYILIKANLLKDWDAKLEGL